MSELENYDSLVSNEFLEGESARASGASLRDNPYSLESMNIVESLKMRDWAKGWCDRDAALQGEGR